MCNDEASQSGHYQVTVVEAYDATTTFKGTTLASTRPTCPTSDGLLAGARLEVQGKDTVARGGCKSVVGDIVSTPPEITLQGPPVSQLGTAEAKDGTDIMVAGAHVTMPAGEGDLVLDLRAGGASGGIFGTPVPGNLPPVILLRTFYPAADPFQRCYDEFVVQMVRQ